MDVPVYQPYHADMSLTEVINLTEDRVSLRGNQII